MFNVYLSPNHSVQMKLVFTTCQSVYTLLDILILGRLNHLAQKCGCWILEGHTFYCHFAGPEQFGMLLALQLL